MNIKIRSSRDFYAGVMFIFFGMVALVEASNYDMGSLMNMGPRYFPSILGCLLTVVGLICLIMGLRVDGEPIKAWHFRPLLIIVAAILFAFLLEPLGLAVALFTLVIISSVGGVEFSFRSSIILYLLLLVFTTILFIHVLELNLKVFPQWNF